MPGTVTVACSLPHGFNIRLQKKEVISAPSREDPSRKEEINVYVGEPIVINGSARNRDKRRAETGDLVPMSGAYALTFGVDKDTWEKWKVQMEDWPPLVAGQVFAAETVNYVKDKARDAQAGSSGFEPYNPSKPPDEFKRRDGRNLIETADKK